MAVSEGPAWVSCIKAGVFVQSARSSYSLTSSETQLPFTKRRDLLSKSDRPGDRAFGGSYSKLREKESWEKNQNIAPRSLGLAGQRRRVADRWVQGSKDGN